MQRYKCISCGCVFKLYDSEWIRDAYEDYTVHKQTYAELSVRYGKSPKTIRKYFDQLTIIHQSPLPGSSISQEPINLTFDTTFFKRRLGVMVFRANSRNIYWKYVEGEKLSDYLAALHYLTSIDHTFKSFTIDGRRGVIRLLERYYPGIPIQLCIFHQVQIVTRYTTRSPKTVCGQDLRRLILNLKALSKEDFIDEFNQLQITHKEFLKERNDEGQFKHRRLRSAVRSLRTNMQYLYTYEDYKELRIPRTTNSADGSFGHWKQKVRLHRHLRIDRMKRMIDELLR